MRKPEFSLLLIFSFLFSPCFGQLEDPANAREISHTFYITANTGEPESNAAQQIFEEINKASANDETASLLLIGNITGPEGYSEGSVRQEIRSRLSENLLEPIRGFNGNTIFIPGVNEWNAAAPQSIDDLESYLQDNSNGEFWPSDGCPLQEEQISENVVLIMVDSQWFLEDWDEHPEMNLDCEIKDREQLFIEFKDDLKDNHGKTKIVAIHHPVMSNNRFGFLNRIGGFTPQSFEHQKLQRLRGRLETLASLYDDVIFVSGAHRNLQYLHNERNPQIISGAAADTEAARAKEEEHFASEENGFARLVVYNDGSSVVEFFELSREGTRMVFSKEIERERPRLEDIEYVQQEELGSTIPSSIYSPEETDKSELHQWIWGDTYREIYSQEIEAPILNIDTIPGNLRPLKEGGGQQSRSLRFINDTENEYTLRALRKSPLRYVQSDLVKGSFIGDFLNNTTIERALADFYTTAQPYAPFAIDEMSEALDIYYVEPEIYYVPKQPGLGIHNDEYGDELYMLEAHPGDHNREMESFGSPEDILSTTDLLLEIRENKDASVNEGSYIRARLFDMLLGDWDRHQDQWRWSEFEEDGEKVYYPIPRDRDQAFSKYDGALIALVKLAVPELRKMQSYERSIKNLKWFNWSGYPLDKSFINEATWEDWEEQVKFLQENLTDEVIEEAFATLPVEVQDSGIEEIKKVLKYRRDHLTDIARSYFDHFSEFDVVTGTEKDDTFEITREEDGVTNISIISGGEQILNKDYDSELTDEIWIYGLDGEDSFNIQGDGSDPVELKVLGGAAHDTYDFNNTRKAKLYDFRSSQNTIVNPRSKKWLVDSYDINRYDYDKRKYHDNKILPIVDFVSNAGFTLGIRNIFTTYGLVRNPFTTQHRLGANYYFATNGYEVNYSSEFAHVFYNWNFGVEGRYTSPNYFLTYFGEGNETTYDRSAVDSDYNRVKIQQWQVSPSLIWRNEAGGSFYFKPLLQSFRVNYEENDFMSDVFAPEHDVFDSQLYGGVELNYNYYNKNNSSYPSLGMEFDVTTGYKENIDEHENQFGYIEPSLSFNYPLVSSGIAVVATKIGGEMILGDNYEFYHGAAIGGNDDLRGYRNDRFNGKRSFYHSTDLRSAFALLQTEFIPIILGASVGFDYGRVWTDDELSSRWHTNYGGALWVNALYAVSGNIGFYHGDDGNRISLMLNFKY